MSPWVAKGRESRPTACKDGSGSKTAVCRACRGSRASAPDASPGPGHASRLLSAGRVQPHIHMPHSVTPVARARCQAPRRTQPVRVTWPPVRVHAVPPRPRLACREAPQVSVHGQAPACPGPPGPSQPRPRRPAGPPTATRRSRGPPVAGAALAAEYRDAECRRCVDWRRAGHVALRPLESNAVLIGGIAPRAAGANTAFIRFLL